MNKLLILGMGQYGTVAKEVAIAMNTFDSIEFLDDYNEKAIGKLDDIKNITYDYTFIAIGNPIIRKKYMNELESIITLVHPKAIIMPSAKIGNGCIIEAGAVICSNAVVGDGVIIMANAVVGHNAIVEDYCQLKYNCVITEGKVIKANTKINCNEVV